MANAFRYKDNVNHILYADCYCYLCGTFVWKWTRFSAVFWNTQLYSRIFSW